MPRHVRYVQGYHLRPHADDGYVAVVGLKSVYFRSPKVHCWIAMVREEQVFCVFRTLRECVAHAIEVYDPAGRTAG